MDCEGAGFVHLRRARYGPFDGRALGVTVTVYTFQIRIVAGMPQLTGRRPRPLPERSVGMDGVACGQVPLLLVELPPRREPQADAA